MAGVSESKKEHTGVVNFFNGKSIFITGAAGFVGVVLLETLLRCCPDIKAVYILLREKKGVMPEDRKKSIVERLIFTKLKAEQPNFMDKIHVMPGDISKAKLGLSNSDLRKVVEEVSVVYHIAASIHFQKPLRFMFEQNVMSVISVIEICRSMKNLKALVYTSTAYANSNRKTHIKEMVYRLPFPSQVFIKEMKTGSDESLQKLVSDCLPAWPNYYTFTKCLAENIFQDTASDLPIAIVRPSLVYCAWKGGMPGYVENQSGMVALSLGCGKGFVRVLCVSPKCEMDIVPVDTVANTHVIAAVCVGSNRPFSPMVINCSSYGSFHGNLKEFDSTLFEMLVKNPIPNSFRLPTGMKMHDHPLIYRLITLYEHYLPALIMDATLLVMGKKPKLLKLYRFFDEAMFSIKYFIANKWSYDTQNFQHLEKHLLPEEKENLSVDLKGLTLKQLANVIPTGAPFYDWKTDKMTPFDRTKLLKQRQLLLKSIQAMLPICVCLLFYITFSKIPSAL